MHLLVELNLHFAKVLCPLAPIETIFTVTFIVKLFVTLLFNIKDPIVFNCNCPFSLGYTYIKRINYIRRQFIAGRQNKNCVA